MVRISSWLQRGSQSFIFGVGCEGMSMNQPNDHQSPLTQAKEYEYERNTKSELTGICTVCHLAPKYFISLFLHPEHDRRLRRFRVRGPVHIMLGEGTWANVDRLLLHAWWRRSHRDLGVDLWWWCEVLSWCRSYPNPYTTRDAGLLWLVRQTRHRESRLLLLLGRLRWHPGL